MKFVDRILGRADINNEIASADNRSALVVRRQRGESLSAMEQFQSDEIATINSNVNRISSYCELASKRISQEAHSWHRSVPVDGHEDWTATRSRSGESTLIKFDQFTGQITDIQQARITLKKSIEAGHNEDVRPLGGEFYTEISSGYFRKQLESGHIIKDFLMIDKDWLKEVNCSEKVKKILLQSIDNFHAQSRLNLDLRET